MEKRGLSFVASFLFAIIVAIISFAILLYFILGVDIKGFGLDETCRLSVLTRATTPDIAKNVVNVPLKCTTRKVCITDKLFGECEEQFLGDDDRIRVGKNSEEAARTIEKTVADSMLSCWKMMGEGKLDLLGNQQSIFSDDAAASCVICSRIALDKDFEFKDKKAGERNQYFEEVISKVDVNRYLSEETAPQSKESYLSLFTDNSIRSYGAFKDELTKNEGKATNEIAVLFAQMNTKEDPFEKAIDVALVGGGFILVGDRALSPVGKIISGFSTVAGKVFFVAQIAELAAASGIAAYAYYKASNDQTISAAYCGEFTSSEKNRKGCSVVTAVDYSDSSKINELCKGGILGRA